MTLKKEKTFTGLWLKFHIFGMSPPPQEQLKLYCLNATTQFLSTFANPKVHPGPPPTDGLIVMRFHTARFHVPPIAFILQLWSWNFRPAQTGYKCLAFSCVGCGRSYWTRLMLVTMWGTWSSSKIIKAHTLHRQTNRDAKRAIWQVKQYKLKVC